MAYFQFFFLIELVYEDGKGNVIDKSSRFVIEMDDDKENYPLDPIIDYDAYTAVMPPEKSKDRHRQVWAKFTSKGSKRNKRKEVR